GVVLPTSREVTVTRSRDGHSESIVDRVAEETPVSLAYHGVPQVVMMATPDHIEDLVFGFTFTESIANAVEIQSVSVSHVQDGLQADVAITANRFSELLKRQRNLTGRTGCGLCGVESIDQAIRKPSRVTADFAISANEMHNSLLALSEQQTLNRMVGSVHGAAWVLPGAGVQVVREDVGRHNALDKVIGAMLRKRIDPPNGYLVITSRASYEMVLKAAAAGVSLLVAVSAPTALAIDLAHDSGMTLVGFTRDCTHVIYTHAERVSA
ncbi:MAG TPA: formate dehydrogenase accessory sulfurtransferase FdhD, partial [Steroidobacteraceae bacterium]|nr:formate dehydrogenase accessory sulfurtransferase FdhD [Steroidobacteraceae bacterium]